MVTYYVVALFRANGRFVKYSERKRSHYAAKKLRKAWDARYDATYYTEIEEKSDE